MKPWVQVLQLDLARSGGTRSAEQLWPVHLNTGTTNYLNNALVILNLKIQDETRI